MTAAILILGTGVPPPAPAAGRVYLYAEADNSISWKDSAGVVRKLVSSPGSLVVGVGKTLTASNSLTLAGVDGRSLTLNRSLTVAGQDGMLLFGGAGSDALTVPAGGGTAVVAVSGEVGIGIASSAARAPLHLARALMVNAVSAGYDEINTALIVEGPDPVMQLIGDDAGQAGQGIMLTGVPAGASPKHWLLHAGGPSRSNRFELRYGTSAVGVSGNIFGTIINSTLTLCVLTTGEVGIGVTMPAHRLDVGGNCQASTFVVGGNQVIGARRTGWVAATGTATRTTFVTSTATLVQVAERLKALIDDLLFHGVIGA